jgi:phage tail sheath gpL-like
MVAIEMAGKKRSINGKYITQRILIPGQYTTLTPVNYVPVQVLTAAKVGELAGFGSEAHRMALWIFAALGGFSENVWWVPIPKPASAGVKAHEDIVFAGPTATSAGSFFFGIGGDVIELPVAKDDAHTAIAAALNTAIAAIQNIAVTAGVVSATVTVTAKQEGPNGNEIGLVLNPGGAAQAAKNPAGIAVTMPVSGYLASGAGTVTAHDALLTSGGADNLHDRWYTIIPWPYTDDTNVGYLKSSGALRLDPAFKRRFAAYLGYVKIDYAAALAKPVALNDQSINPAWDPRSYAPAWEMAAAVAGAVAASAMIDPGRPFKTLPVGIPVNNATANLSYAENDALFRAGMGYFKTDDAGVLRIVDLACSYRKTPGGADTEEWFDAESIHLRQQKMYDEERIFTGAPYDRGRLASDDVVTSKAWVIKPKTMVTDMINLVDYWAGEGWTKNPETVKASIVAEINATFSGRMDSEITDDDAAVLRIIALKHLFLF